MAAPGGTGPIGPYPDDVADDDAAREDYDRRRRRVLWNFPSGLFVIGSRHDGRRNLMTLNWCTQVSFDPKLLAISVERTAVTHELIAGGRSFTVNLVSRDDRAIVRKFTKPVEEDPAAGTLNGFAFHDGPATGAPVLDQAPAFVECEVRQEIEVGDHTLFVGEVVNAVFQSEAEDADVLRMEDTRMNYGG